MFNPFKWRTPCIRKHTSKTITSNHIYKFINNVKTYTRKIQIFHVHLPTPGIKKLINNFYIFVVVEIVVFKFDKTMMFIIRYVWKYSSMGYRKLVLFVNRKIFRRCFSFGF